MTLPLRRKHQTTAATTPRAKGADRIAPSRPHLGRGRDAGDCRVTLAIRPLAADPIPIAAKSSGKLAWRSPKLLGEATASPAAASQGASRLHEDDEFDREATEAIKPTSTTSRSTSSLKSSSTFRSTAASSASANSPTATDGSSSSSIRWRSHGLSQSVEDSLDEGQDEGPDESSDEWLDEQDEQVVDRIPARQSLDDLERPSSQSSRLARAARPYSRKAQFSKPVVQRLTEAEPAPFSNDPIENDESSLAIVQVSAVEDLGPAMVAPKRPRNSTLASDS